jgi:hypothetical protein
MARTTISISDALKKRMDRVKEPVNWSAVASEAFELKLGEIARQQKEKTMDTVVARLRASKIQSGTSAEKHGREVGIGWAKGAAEFDELRRLSKLNADEFFNENSWGGSNAFGPSEILAFNILGEEQPFTRSDASDFWENIVDRIDDEVDSLDFLRGFTEGALSIYGQVADSL